MSYYLVLVKQIFLKFLFNKNHLGFWELFCLDAAYFYLIPTPLFFIDVSVNQKIQFLTKL